MKKFAIILMQLSLMLGAAVASENGESCPMDSGVKAMQTGDFAGAAGFFQEALEKDPENVDALYYLGTVEFYVQDCEAALESFTRGRELAPEQARFHSMRGHCLSILGQKKPMMEAVSMFMECLEEYRAAVRLDEDDIEGHFGLANYFAYAPAIGGGNPVMAEEHANKVIELDAMRGTMLMATIKRQLGQVEEAVVYAKKVLELDPENGEAQGFLASLQDG